MKICFVLSAIILQVCCSTLPCEMSTTGLYENIVTFPKKIEKASLSKLTIEIIEVSSGENTVTDILSSYENRFVYGLVDYDSIKDQLYDKESGTNNSIQVFYGFLYTMKDTKEEGDIFNVRFVGLSKDSGNTLELRTDSANVYLDLIGGTIKNQFKKVMKRITKEKILEYEITTKLDYDLFYFETYEECLKELKRILADNINIIGMNIKDSASKFMTYFTKGTIKNEHFIVSTEDFVRAVRMATDLYNMAGHIENPENKKSSPFHVQAPSAKYDVINVYRSVCIKPAELFVKENSIFTISGFDINGKGIKSNNFLHKIISGKIIIPFQDLIDLEIKTLEVEVDGVKSDKLSIVEFLKDDQVDTNN